MPEIYPGPIETAYQDLKDSQCTFGELKGKYDGLSREFCNLPNWKALGYIALAKLHMGKYDTGELERLMHKVNIQRKRAEIILQKEIERTPGSHELERVVYLENNTGRIFTRFKVWYSPIIHDQFHFTIDVKASELSAVQSNDVEKHMLEINPAENRKRLLVPRNEGIMISRKVNGMDINSIRIEPTFEELSVEDLINNRI